MAQKTPLPMRRNKLVSKPLGKQLERQQVEITWANGNKETVTHAGLQYVTGALLIELESGVRRVIPFSSLREFRIPKLA